MSTIDVIRPILTDDDFAALAELRDELEDTFLRAQIFRTRTEMEASVLNDIKRPTPDAKYWQAVREQQVMFSELMNLSYDYRETLVKLEKARRRLENWAEEEGDDLDKELVQIEIDRLNWIRQTQERIAHDRIRELGEWSDIKATLIPQLACGTEDPGRHQLVSYAIGWLREIQAGGLDKGSQAERVNLVAKTDAILKLAAEQQVLDTITEAFPKEFISRLIQSGIGGNAWQQLTSGSHERMPEKA